MPTLERGATATTVVAAGWTNPANAYQFDNTYAYTSTDAAEQSYSGFGANIGGNETIDKVFAKIEHYIAIAKNAAGDSAEVTCTLKAYDGTSWTSYQITNLVYTNATPLTDEQPTVTVGNNNAVASYIDITATINTIAKLANTQLALLYTVVTAGAGCTITWYVDAVTLITCYTVGSAGSMAVTKRDIPERPRKQLEAVEKALNIISQSQT